jgi:hypothetical protein
LKRIECDSTSVVSFLVRFRARPPSSYYLNIPRFSPRQNERTWRQLPGGSRPTPSPCRSLTSVGLPRLWNRRIVRRFSVRAQGAEYAQSADDRAPPFAIACLHRDSRSQEAYGRSPRTAPTMISSFVKQLTIPRPARSEIDVKAMPIWKDDPKTDEHKERRAAQRSTGPCLATLCGDACYHIDVQAQSD